MKQKVAIVTGANRGVGYSTVKTLSENGYRVIATVRDAAEAKKILPDNVEVHQLNLTNFSEIEMFFEKYKDIKLDLLVNNAGGGLSPTYIIHETPENFKYAYDLNVTGPMYLCKLFLPCMKRSDSPSIIFITSLGGKNPYPSGGNYTNAKRGQMGLADTIRIEFAEYNVTVTEICPGTIDTQKEKKDNALKPEDIAETIRWLSSLPNYMNVNLIELNHITSNRFK